MIEADQGCTDVLVQVAAARAAINKVGGLILENYSKTCIKKAAENELEDKQIDELIETIVKYTK
jgi:DNA-binding FrmR family transcriptional regulator